MPNLATIYFPIVVLNLKISKMCWILISKLHFILLVLSCISNVSIHKWHSKEASFRKFLKFIFTEIFADDSKFVKLPHCAYVTAFLYLNDKFLSIFSCHILSDIHGRRGGSWLGYPPPKNFLEKYSPPSRGSLFGKFPP